MSGPNAWMIIFTNPANNYVSLVSTPLYFYDYLITFADEVNFIWKRRLSGATVMFALNRYAALLACFVNMFGFAKCHFTQELDIFGISRFDVCEAEIRIVDICTVVAYGAFAGFAALRIYALYGLSKWIFWIILALGLVNVALQILIIATYSITHIDIAPELSGCFRNYDLEPFVPLNLLVPWQNPIFWQRIYTLVYETVLVALTWHKTLSHYKSRHGLSPTPIMTLLRRDGTIYFILLLAATILNVIGLSIPNNETSPLNCMGTLIDTISSIFMSYFILNLRSVDTKSVCTSESPSLKSQTAVWDTLRFVNPDTVVGNLGESMRDEEDDEDGEDADCSDSYSRDVSAIASRYGQSVSIVSLYSPVYPAKFQWLAGLARCLRLSSNHHLRPFIAFGCYLSCSYERNHSLEPTTEKKHPDNRGHTTRRTSTLRAFE